MRQCLFALVASAAISGCMSSTFVAADQHLNRDGVAVISEYPTDRQFAKIGTFTVNYYQPGWSPPTVEDAMPKLIEKAKSVGGNALIIRNHALGEWTRNIVIDMEVIKVN